MSSITRGWALAKQSWLILRSDLSLLIFPVLSTLFGIAAVAAIWLSALFARGVFDGHHLQQRDPAVYAAGLVSAYVATFIAIFFNVALAACATRSLRGEDTRVSEGIKAAAHRIGPIIGWTLVMTTVGLLLKTLEKRVPLLGDIAVWLTEAAWAIATFFVVPVIALEGPGPIQSLKRSAAVVRSRWGEGATGAATIGLLSFLVSLLIAIIGGVGAVALVGAGLPWGAVAVATIAVAAIIVVSFASSALSQIFRVALYEYAVTGQALGRFDGDVLRTAFIRTDEPPNRWQDTVTGRPL